MYYTNISNPELQQFHKVFVPNFTIALTDVFSSGLFRVDTVIADSIFKVYPLFYVKEVTSSNVNDKILDNQCIICEKLDTETYLTFISDVGGEIRDYSNYASYFSVGDSLTTAEFNSIVSLLRHNVVNVDGIRINDSVNGVYGVYEFDIVGTTILDNGIVVSDETISAEPKVRLSNPTFPNSTYTLKLQVLHFTDVNILDDDSDDYKVIETLEIELANGEWVDIPVTDLSEGYVILFDANVEIRHDKSIIQDWVTQLFLTGDKPIIQTGDSETLTATALDDLGNGVDGVNIDFVQKSKHLLTDKGTSAKNSDWYDNNLSTDIFERKTDYTQLKYSASKNCIQLIPSITANKVYFKFKTYESNLTDDFVIIQFQNGQTAKSFGSLSISANSVVEIELNGNKMNAWVNGVQTLTNNTLYGNISEDDFNIRFGLNPNSDGIKVSDVIVDVEDLLLDSATTSNGVATDTVTGTGYGLIKNVARFNDLESNEYEFLDAIFYDADGTNTKWDTLFVTKSVEQNGIKFLCTSTNASARATMNPYDNSSVYDFPPMPMMFECDLVDFDTPSGNVGMQYIQTGGANKTIAFNSNDIGHRIGFAYDGNKLTKYIDGVAQANPISVSYTGNMRVGFYLYAKDGYIIVKNVKAYPLSRVEPTSVALTGSAPIIQTGDTLTLSAKATGVDGVCTGNRIDFIQKPTSSNTWTQIGSALTDETGTALLNYTGVGQGDVDFKAKYSNIQSEPYQLLDCIINDSNISDWRNPNSMPISMSEGIITVSNSASSNRYLYAQLNSSQTYAHDFVIEMEYYGYTGTAITRVYNGTNADKHFSSMGLSNGDILEIKVTSDKVRYYKNGTEISGTAKDYTSDPSYFALIINNGSISFKNLKIYPI